MYARDLDRNLATLATQLRDGTYRPQPIRRTWIDKPGSREQRPLGIEKDTGAWSLFRFLDLLQKEPASGRNIQILKADLAGLRANYRLTSQRTPGPFDMDTWRTFRLPEQL